MDFDFKYKDKIESRQYNQNVLKNIINLIFEKLDILYDIPSEQKVCWIMEKLKTYMNYPKFLLSTRMTWRY